MPYEKISKCYAILLSLLADMLLFLLTWCYRKDWKKEEEEDGVIGSERRSRKQMIHRKFLLGTPFPCDPLLIHEGLSDLCLCDQDILLPSPPLLLPQGVLRLGCVFFLALHRKEEKLRKGE